MPKRSKPNEPAWVLVQPGLRVIAQSTDALFFSGRREVITLTLRLEFPDGARRRQWVYEYVIRRNEGDGVHLLEKFRGTNGDPSRDELIETWTESKGPT